MKEKYMWSIEEPDNYKSLKNLTGALRDTIEIESLVANNEVVFKKDMTRIKNAVYTTIIGMITKKED